MVDVGKKPITSRRAVASALVILKRDTLEHLWSGNLEKGDALAVARLAGIQGAKQTANLVPLCHPLPLDQVTVEMKVLPEQSAIRIFTEARTRAATGVEMEALTAAAVAALALIDMVKGLDREARIAEVRLELKEGGSSGRWTRDGHEDPFAVKHHAPKSAKLHVPGKHPVALKREEPAARRHNGSRRPRKKP